MFSLFDLSAFFAREDGAATANIVVLIVGIVGLGVASAGVLNDEVSGAPGVLDTHAQLERAPIDFHASSSVCTADGGHCAYDHDGDGMVDELRNYSRGSILNVEGNGLSMQGYKDGGWG